MRLAAVFFGICLIFAAVPGETLGQTTRPADLTAHRISIPPKLDGVLDDDAWAGDPLPLNTWMSYNPMRGEAAAEQTSVWIAYDDSAVYFAFRCLDTQPDRIRTNISRRDNAFNDDWVGLSLDSSRAGQLAYHLFVNPSGIQMDALQSGSNGEDFAPDWVWQSAGHVGAEGWSVEIRVPLENIRFRSGPHVEMGVLFWRRLSRTGVSTSWPEMPPGKWVFDANAVVVFDELQSRRLLEVIPSSTFSSNQARKDESLWNGSRARGDFGVSVKYGVTSAVTLDATVNPDFSQVESDAFEVEVNQRFPVFFSEKRPFFMEGSRAVQHRRHRRRRHDAHRRSHAEDHRSQRRAETDRRGRQTYLRRAVVGRRESRRHASARLHCRSRSHELRPRASTRACCSPTPSSAPITIASPGGDVAFKRGEHFSANGSFLSSHSRTLTGETKQRNRRAGLLRLQHAPLQSPDSSSITIADSGWTRRSSIASGLTRGWQYQALNFYPSHRRFQWVKRINPFFWMAAAKDRVQGGTETYYLPAVRFNFTRAGFLRRRLRNGHETFAGQEFDVGRMMVDGGVQILRWLNIGGSAQKGPAIFYDRGRAVPGRSTVGRASASGFSRTRASTAIRHTTS